jgi:23S rRNA (uracil1939-C5)-methyltransferase
MTSSPASPWGYRRRARKLELSAKDPTIADGFRQANAKAIVDVVQCPVLVPQLEALLPAVRECLSALSALRHLGHVELVQADNGPLMVLRHTAALPAATGKNWNAFRKLTVFPCTSRRKARYWNIFMAKRHGIPQTDYA